MQKMFQQWFYVSKALQQTCNIMKSENSAGILGCNYTTFVYFI